MSGNSLINPSKVDIFFTPEHGKTSIDLDSWSLKIPWIGDALYPFLIGGRFLGFSPANQQPEEDASHFFCKSTTESWPWGRIINFYTKNYSHWCNIECEASWDTSASDLSINSSIFYCIWTLPVTNLPIFGIIFISFVKPKVKSHPQSWRPLKKLKP